MISQCPNATIPGACHMPSGSDEDFYRIWKRWLSSSCDSDTPNKLSFPLPTGASLEIWLCLAKQFLRRSLKMMDGRWTTHAMG